MTKIILVDDHLMMRIGLKSLINSTGIFTVVGEASDGLQMLDVIRNSRADIVLLDLSMPSLDGIEGIARIKKLPLPPRILVLTANTDSESITAALENGADGYITKDAGKEKLITAINSVMTNRGYLNEKLREKILLRPRRASSISILSMREREILKMLCDGVPNREVARALNISTRTIDSHRANILKKLGANSNSELVKIAIENKLL